MSRILLCLSFACVVTEAATSDFCSVTEAWIAGQHQSIESGLNSCGMFSRPLNASHEETRWTACSVSCGEGVQKKICRGGVCGTKKCFLKFCPGYLSSPRIHFFGSFTADVSTINNARCNYVTERFSAAAMKEGLPYLTKKGVDVISESNNWNPEGTGRFQLHAEVTSVCISSGNCTTDDSMVGRTVKETSVVAMVDVDPDWQVASEIYGMRLKIEGVLEARFVTSAIQSPKRRGNNVYAALKSQLSEVTWVDENARSMFTNANRLSIAMTMDQFFEESREGRLTGTIGPTSSDDPISTSATRRLLSTPLWGMKGSAPFYVNERSLTIDLSLVFNCSEVSGLFNVTDLGDLDLAVYVADEESLRHVTVAGGLSRKLAGDWYETFGGIIDFDLPEDASRLIASQRLVMTQTLPGESKHARVIMSEAEEAINFGFMESHVHRLNVGDSFRTKVFVSSFGRPLNEAQVSIQKVSESYADVSCGWDLCKSKLGVPVDALHTSQSSSLDAGFAHFRVSAAKDPRNARGCGLDGQIYPIAVQLKYKGTVFVDGGLLRQSPNVTKDHDVYLAVVPAVVAIYSETPEIECPLWGDIEPIFIRYHNLYPVMWRHGIIDMSSYDDIKRKSKMLEYAMLEVDFEDPRFMPITRDLSRSKTKLVANWLKCGMKKESPTPTCSLVDEQLSQLRASLQRAVTLELTIIPPYFTAWLSLQTELGRNQESADIVKSVFVDEMLHMSLAGNILNAINGSVNLTTFSNLPFYPTSLGFGKGYKLIPDLVLTLGKMSRGVVNDVFMPVERPADAEQRKILQKVANLLEILKNPKYSSSKFFMEELADSSAVNRSNSELWVSSRDFAAKGLRDLSATTISSIGAFYSKIALQLTLVESCFQVERASTIFTGDVSHQMNMSHWHRPQAVRKSSDPEILPDLPVFEVTDLRSALEAIVAIINEGEGGPSCAQFSDNARGELSHYYRFMEIVRGRRLENVPRDPAQGTGLCLNTNEHYCTAGSKQTEFCFTGDIVPFHSDGVWPIITNPDESMYSKSSKVEKWNKEFNLLYTSLLRCLEISFGGKPDHVKQCMQEMHSMRIIGKKVVQSPVMRNGHVIGHGTPTWVFQRGRGEELGLPNILGLDELY